MNIQRGTRAAPAVLFAVLTAYGHSPKAAVPDTASAASAATSGELAVPAPSPGADSGAEPGHERVAPLPLQRMAFDHVDMYKADAAHHIMRHNMAHTFSGALPPILPAVVVLRITVDYTGKLTRVIVQRSRNNMASAVAVASMQRTAYLPMPYNLAREPGRSLTFMETFLFDRDYRFQLRTLAPVQ
jgi:protein TonB